MIHILPESTDRMLAVVVSGRLEEDDYARLEPELGRRAQRERPFDLLVEVGDVAGLEPAVIREELEFTRDYAKHIGRMAVVTTDALWRRVTDVVGRPLGEVLDVDIERFEDREEAMQWLSATSVG